MPEPPVKVTFDTCLKIYLECHWCGVWQVLGAQGWNKERTSVTDFPVVNQIHISDEEPICGMCKLFEDHKSHQVARISDAYAEESELC